MLDTKTVLDVRLKQMPYLYRDVTLIPLIAETQPGGGLLVSGPDIAVEVPASTIKQLKGLAKVIKKGFEPASLISPCPFCKKLALVYTGMEMLGEELAMKYFSCASCGKSDSEPID